MDFPRLRVLTPDGTLLGEVTFTADLTLGQALQASFRPATYEALFRGYIAVMRAERLPAKDPEKAAKINRAKRALRRVVRTAKAEVETARTLLATQHIALDDTDIAAEAKAEAALHYDTHTHSKPA